MLKQGVAAVETAAGVPVPATIVAGIAVTVLVAWAIIWLLQPFARPLKLLDFPRGRKDHAQPTPVTGGLGMVLALSLFFLLIPLPMTQTKWAFILGGALLVFVGLLDDRYDLRWWWRILAQVVAALVMIFLGEVRVEQLGRAFGFDDLSLGVLSVPFTVFATVGLINAVNMIDGADGIAGTLVAAALLMLAAAAWYAGNEPLGYVALAILAVVIGFLLHNFPLPWRLKARVFMGNAGSAFLGYSIAWISFRLTQNSGHPVSPVLALWLLPVPVMDCLVLILRRLREGRSPFAAGRDHIHHMMRDAGFGAVRLTLLLAAFSLLAGLCVGQAMRMDIPDPLLLGGFLLLCAGWYWLSADRTRADAFFARLLRLLPAQAATADVPAASACGETSEIGTVVADDGVAEQQVFFAGALADIVQDQRGAVGGMAVGNDADVQQAAANQLPGDDVAGAYADRTP